MTHGTSPSSAHLTEHGIQVLLVDDQAIVATAVRRMLEPEGDIAFHACQDPTQAIGTAISLGPTVILQDLVMPEIDGLTLVKFYRSHPKLRDIPLIVLSTKEEAVTKAEAFALGAHDYLVKLPDRIELVARIRYHSRAYINLLQRNEAFDALLRSQEALAAELAQAARYVESLLPPPVLDGPLQTRWRFIPSAQLGGDCFGYHWIDEDHFAMYLLDVCGHGVGSALLSVSAFNVIRSQSLAATDFHSPEEVLTRLNEAFPMEKQNGLYFTIWYGVYDRRTRQLAYASGGHPPAFLMTGSGDTRQLATPNMFIGGMPDTTYEGDAVVVPPAANLYIFSDGVYEVEQAGGAMWRLEDLNDFLLRATDPAGGEIDALHRHVQTLYGRPVLEDDFSLLRVTIA